jgi:hypothetical protein
MHSPARALRDVQHREPATFILSVEDPKLIFYLKNLVWRTFTRQVGYTTDYFLGKYDFCPPSQALIRSLLPLA